MTKKIELKVTLTFSNEEPDVVRVIEKLEDFLQSDYNPGVQMCWPEVDLIIAE